MNEERTPLLLKDTNTFRSLLYKKKVTINENLKLISSRLKQPGLNMSKIQKDKIIKDLRDATNRYEELINIAHQKEAQHNPINDPESIEFHRNSYRDPQMIGSPERTPQDQESKYMTFGLGGQLIDQEQIYNDIIEERNKATRQLVDDLRTLQEVVGDISELVVEQGEQLQTAHTNVVQADANVEVAVDELQDAMVYKTSYRKKVFFLVICLSITFIALAIFLGLWFGVFHR
ncbi:hypothetical protein SAMD00019534_032700 [Acytostelium subglobosum LB1]|uniref:hypothetical protein n=1 Tax=Acytostelium subglobosum LB1 TaxID=1410327 RepID=UPI000644AFCF|nr:hypothetical protein SAMD00019534_032700 [Acytostelium subglobosum LB1]GAM20095.1 hypothetical protein SAMD00019534_032700 [Acytostelium subglobosum LB1]|eukprot:XP_012756857.1 hypothetical protein SAMD00019534_032700 [Acytostelium subglobosum LB1]